MPEWTTACPDWEEKIVKGESLIPLKPLFPDYAKKALDIFCALKIRDIGRRSFGDVSRQWVLDFVSAVFGAYDEENGRQLIREFFLFVGKKNTKSTLAAGIMMTALILNWRESAEFIILAPTVRVAGNSFDPAFEMCREEMEPELYDMMIAQQHYKTIRNINTNASLKVIAADSQTVAGIKGSGHFIDELHEFGKKDSAKSMIREATGGMSSRPEGFVIWASTQSDETPAGIFGEKLEYARGVRDGKIDDPSFLPIIYEYPKSYIAEKKYLNSKYFYIANPNLGASVDEEHFLRDFKKSKIESEQPFQIFCAKCLNIQPTVSLKAQRWSGADFWEAAIGNITLDTILTESEVIVIGIDGGGRDDLLGLAVLGRHAETGDWLLWVKAWAHPIALKRRKSEEPKYRDFERDGDLVVVDSERQDITEVADLVMRCDASGLLDRVGVDPHGIEDIPYEIEARGLPRWKEDPTGEKPHDRIVAIPQGWRLSKAINTLDRRLSDHMFLHGGQPIMNWCVGNARCDIKGNNIHITKQESGTAKIDPLIATFNAVSLMMLRPESRLKRSVYDDLTEDEILERISI